VDSGVVWRNIRAAEQTRLPGIAGDGPALTTGWFPLGGRCHGGRKAAAAAPWSLPSRSRSGCLLDDGIEVPLRPKTLAVLGHLIENCGRLVAAGFSRIVLAAAYAEEDRTEDAARAVAEMRRFDPAFDAREFGGRLLDAGNLEHLREGLRKAGLLSTPSAASPSPAE
jgi:hypothetical protein